MASTKKALEDMFYAAVIGNVDMLKDTISNGADINSADEDGSTALMLAAVNGQEAAVRFLLQNGADPQKEDVDGWNAAKLAENAGYNQISQMIMQSKSNAKSREPAKELEEAAIVGFVEERADDIQERLKTIRDQRGKDGEMISETNHLNILLFAESSAFYQHLDEDARSSVNSALERLNKDFSATASESNRKLDSVDVESIKNYDFSRLLQEDEKLLKRITQEIYNAVLSFTTSELKIPPSEFAVKYKEYHKRLLQMREALLDSMRAVGAEGKEGKGKITMANIIGAKAA